MNQKREVKTIIEEIRLSDYSSWKDNELISLLQKAKNRCKNECRMQINKEYGYYDDISHSLIIYDVRLETTDEYNKRVKEEKKKEETYKLQEIERAKEVLKKAGITT